jgi:hypothetical protein
MLRLRAFVLHHKTFFVSIGFLVIFSFTVARANPPGSPYTAGQTLDPACAPGSTDCTVSVSSAGLNFSSGLTNTAGTITDNLATGVAGGQTIVGGTGANDALSLVGTSGNGTLTNSAIKFNVGNNGATNAMTIANNGNVGIGVSPSNIAELSIGGTRSSTAWGLSGSQLQIRSAALTDTSSSGTVASMALNTITASSVSSTNLATYTNASTLYISGAPTAGTNAGITNPWAFSTGGGNVNLGGDKLILGSAIEKIAVVSNGNGASLSFNRDPTLGNTYDSNGYAYTFSHTRSIVNTADKLSLGVFSPTGTTLSTPLTITGQGYVGINTTTPSQMFSVNGNIQISGTGNGLYFPDGSFVSTATGGTGVDTSSTTDVDFSADSDDNGSGVINFAVGGQGHMVLANNGEVGIDTTTPTQPLTVNGNIQIAGMGNGIYFPDGSFMGSAANIGTGISAPGNISLNADTDQDGVGEIDFDTSTVERAVISNNGNVGIGTTTPVTTLQVVPTTGKGVVIGSGSYPSFMGTDGLYVYGALHANANLVNSGSGINWGASQARIVGVNPALNTNSYLSFYTGSVATQAERMRIIDNGNVGIGTITPNYLLGVGSSVAPTATPVAEFINAGGTCDLDPSTTGGLSCSSDMTLKKNITNLSDGSSWSFNTNISPANQTVLSDILALNPVDYNWNIESNTAPKHAGFIAQEVQQVFPDLVQRNPNTDTLSLDYTGLVPYTIEAIKEMNVDITDIDDLNKTNTWRDALDAWFADSANGIQNLFSQKVTSNEVDSQTICLGAAGDQTCITKAQLDQLLQNQQVQPATSDTGSTSDTSSSADTATAPDTSDTPTDTDDTQSPEVTQPQVTPPVVTDAGSTQSPD